MNYHARSGRSKVLVRTGCPCTILDFERGFHREFGMRGVPGMGFGFFSPLMFLGRIAILALIVWFIYWLFTRSGWRLTRELSRQRNINHNLRT